MKTASRATPNLLLRHERELRGWSLKDVAGKVDTDSRTVGRWERGITFPGPYSRQKLCALFGKTAQELGLLREDADLQKRADQPLSSQYLASGSIASSTLLVWNVPHRRNPFFTGRAAILADLDVAFQTQKTVALTQTLAISGLGGIGKTQAAVEYAYRSSEHYQYVLWVRADTRAMLNSDFVSIAGLLKLPERDEQDQREVVKAVQRWLQNNHNWLLIFDNADDLTILSDFLPTSSEGHILLTTREQVTGNIAGRVSVEKMSPEEGALFLLRRAKLIGSDASLDTTSYADWMRAKAINDVMDGLPLALDQAGAYIEETDCGLAGYLKRFETRRARLLSLRGASAQGHCEPVATTWSLSFEKVQKAYPSAANLLRLCAFLHPDAIHEEIISEGVQEPGPTLESLATDLVELDSAISQLRRFSLVKRDPDTQSLSLHRLVQAVLRDQMDDELQRQWTERAIKAVNSAFPSVDFSTWPRCQLCLLHAQLCAGYIKRWNMAFPEAARLLHLAGIYLGVRAQYEQAEQFMQQALAIREQVEPTHPDVAETLNDLAMLYNEQGKRAEAEALLLRALAIHEGALGPHGPKVGETLCNLSTIYNRQGKYAEAETCLLRGLSILESVLGQRHVKVGNRLDDLALLYLDEGKYAEAEPLFRRALAILEHALGPVHPEVAICLNNFGMLYEKQGKYSQAEKLNLRSLAIRKQVFGPEHPKVTHSLNNLAIIYTDQGKYAQAEELYRQTLAILEKAFGLEHPHVASTMSNLACVYSRLGKYLEAESLHLQVLAIREKIFPSDHPHIAITLNLLGQLYFKQGEFASAESFCQRALELREKILGSDHSQVAENLEILADICSSQGQYERAKDLYQRALAIWERSVGLDHPDAVAALQKYSALRRADGQS